MSDDSGSAPQGSPEPTPEATTLPLGQKLLYSSGYFGVSILNGLFMLWVVDFYHHRIADAPKSSAVADLATWIGPILLFGRVFDAISDPLVGYFSDRTKTRWGRRRPYIALGTVPLVIVFALIWMPPTAEGTAGNLWWLLGMSAAYFTLFSIVVNPYLAMLPDIARTDSDRVATSSLQAFFGLTGEAATMIGGSILAGIIGLGPTSVLVAALAAAALLLALLIREPSAEAHESMPTFGLVAAVRETLANRPFRVFLLSKCMFWISIRIVLAALPFYVVAVLGSAKEERELSVALLLAFGIGTAMVFFALMKRLARRFSKRKLALAGLLSLAIVTALLAVVGLVPVAALWQARMLLLLAGFPIAVVFAIPNAILADIVDLDERMTGSRREAIYYGAQGFFVKISWGAAAAVVTVSLKASDVLPALGERLCFAAVALVALIAFLTFLPFPEDRVLKRMNDARRLRPENETDEPLPQHDLE